MSDTGQRKNEWLDRIKRVEMEFHLVEWSVEFLESQIRRDPTVVPAEFDLRDYNQSFRREAREHLEGTYFIRVFAEFETGLRVYWETTRKTEPPTKDLMNGIAAARPIPSEQIEAAHAVREYRNSLVHEREDEVEPIPLSDAVADLCKFFSYLPYKW